ncbi:ACS family glucarate transporter-like MFS transporter [Methylobacterium sp. PvP062]|jgi:ACS family glucarate transporter-like MFS transporter|uniref:ACS family glucarate transporter-like MFS transporter n=1 Tax=Methylobacterium radiotolerans TaxID=31998 RepID=A0ABV2NEP4_9HYPH|nr:MULTISPECIES: MFS transporter [unclassified Methylobacterium]KTS09212.1 glucarate transporter [Methylobacterium radiotolerans]MCX7332680.1 MFS transporter [Hyphomicrobiales bacterium]KTS44052.1 glucarate transporter [Methylobacterium radiotolerans]MBP2491842.1 ACS family glucarate transporter-like MFS transporter [Methylobacterium sp. PvP105]MBP2501786.1 ACS family glucarate transporter-like MFS transporter [Methylobacterium sp. PvP109]
MSASSTGAPSTLLAAADAGRRTRVRLLIVAMLFAATTINYADRATISIAGPDMAKELGLSPVQMGYVFSAFAWSYVLAQIPGGWLLDRYSVKWVYAAAVALWSAFTLVQGAVGFFTGLTAVVLLFALRLAVGLTEAPVFPANARIVAAWFPTRERGMASAFFNSAQYFATVLFTPLMAWIVHTFGWHHVFTSMGLLGIAFAVLWLRVVDSPKHHPAMNQAERDYIEAGGALLDMDGQSRGRQGDAGRTLRQLLANRMLLGIYVGQYCITVLTYFFLTWFPVYLVKERGLSILQAGFAAVLPALCGFIGGILGGVISDLLLRRGFSLTAARKIPIVGGMLLSMSIIGCNYVQADAVVVGLMALAFFGKGIGALGWAVVADTSPRESGGLSGGLFNTFGNTAGITTPIAIGYIVQSTGSFNGALVFVGLNALVACFCYLVVVGEIRRVELKAH